MNRYRFPWRLFSRIVLVQALLVLSALMASGLAARYFFKKQFIAQVESQLHTTLDILSRELAHGQPKGGYETWCQAHASPESLRITLIARGGKVLCDSSANPQEMGSHASRPEVVEAFEKGFGENERFSTTLGLEMLYSAILLKEQGLVIRGAIPLSALMKTLRLFDTSLAFFLMVVAAVIGGFAVWAAQSLVFPIGRLLVKARNVLGESDEDIDETAYGELGDLESSLENIRRDLEAKAERLNQQTEEQATLMSAISDSILAIDLEGAPLFYNSRFIVLFGSKGFREKNLRLWEMFREPEILGAYRAALQEGKANHVAAIPFDQEGGRKFFSISVSPLRRSSGETYGAVGIFHDVTELKLAEQMRIDFVANVSHELRTPLTAIKGYADTVTQDIEAGRPVAREFIDIITRNTARLMSLITDLLDLSSLDANADDLQKASLSTEEVTNRVMAQLKGTFLKKNQDVSVTISAKTVLADPRRLEQVFVNLLDNASKYTPQDGRISILWEQNGDAVLLRVTDSGPGIPREHHARLFERFYRVDKARSRELGGTGLGLAIVKHIMQRHGGMIWVESAMGRGSSFICKFPGSEA